MSKGIHIKVIGGAWIEIPDSGVRITAPKQVALIAYLALGPVNSVSRRKLAGLLWENSGEEKAKGSLRQALSDLKSRSALFKNLLKVDRATITLNPSLCAVDLIDLKEKIVQGKSLDDFAITEDLIDSILYGVEHISEGLSDWITSLRDKVKSDVIACLEQQVDNISLGLRRRLDMAQMAVTLNPLNEILARTAMQLSYKANDIGGALRTYSRLYARMDAELDMEPSLETQDLAAEIKLNSDKNVKAASSSPSPNQNHSIAFGKPIIAILPLVPSNKSETNRALMLTDAIISQFSSMKDISVISRLALREIVDLPDFLNILTNQMNVSYIVSGSLDFGETSVSIMMQVISLKNGHVLHSSEFQTNRDDPISINSQIVTQIVHSVLPSVNNAELESTKNIEISDLSAYKQILRAEELIYSLSRPQLDTAEEILISVAERYPQHASVYTTMADLLSLRLGQGWSDQPDKHRELLIRYLNAALEIDKNNPRALAMLGHNLIIYEHEFEPALSYLEKAYEMAPGDPETLFWTGPGLVFAGQHELALERMLHAKNLAMNVPLSFRHDHFIALAYFALDHLDEALKSSVMSFQLNGLYRSNFILCAALCAYSKNDRLLREVKQRILMIEPEFSVSRYIVRPAFRCAHPRSRLRDLLLRAGLPN